MAEPPYVLHSVDSIRQERDDALSAKYGGFYRGSDFIGFAVAIFFTLVSLGIVGAAVGTVGYQTGAPVPKIGGTLGANYHRHIDRDAAGVG